MNLRFKFESEIQKRNLKLENKSQIDLGFDRGSSLALAPMEVLGPLIIPDFPREHWHTAQARRLVRERLSQRPRPVGRERVPLRLRLTDPLTNFLLPLTDEAEAEARLRLPVDPWRRDDIVPAAQAPAWTRAALGPRAVEVPGGIPVAQRQATLARRVAGGAEVRAGVTPSKTCV